MPSLYGLSSSSTLTCCLLPASARSSRSASSPMSSSGFDRAFEARALSIAATTAFESNPCSMSERRSSIDGPCTAFSGSSRSRGVRCVRDDVRIGSVIGPPRIDAVKNFVGGFCAAGVLRPDPRALCGREDVSPRGELARAAGEAARRDAADAGRAPERDGVTPRAFGAFAAGSASSSLILASAWSKRACKSFTSRVSSLTSAIARPTLSRPGAFPRRAAPWTRPVPRR